MLTITRDINVYAQGQKPIVNLSQYDDDFRLVFRLYTSNGTFTMPDGTTAQIQGTKTDGNGYSAAASVSGNTVTVAGHVQMTAAAGPNVFEIVTFYNNKRLSTINFILAVERAALDSDTVSSESVIKDLSNIPAAVEQAEAAADRAEEAARTLTIDPTLTQSGQAADAKVTGEEIDGLKEDLNASVKYISKTEDTKITDTQLDFPNVDKNLDNSGNLIEATDYSVTDFINLDNIIGIYRTGTTIKFSLWRCAFYDDNYDFLSISKITDDYDIVEYEGKQVTWLNLNENAKYIRIAWNRPNRPYTYHAVRNVENVTSYTLVPIFINGEDIYENGVKGKQAKVITDDITYATSVNILNPSEFKANGYYYDFSDGTTKINNVVYQMTENMIEVDQDEMYVIQTFSTTSTNNFAVYCYDIDDEYLGYRTSNFATYGERFRVSLITGTKKVRIYSNSGEITGDQICITLKKVDSFIEYRLEYKVKSDALPEDSATTHLPLYGKVIANFGDSIFGNKRPPNDISTSLATMTGAKVYNLGFGGCRMAKHSANWDAFSMYRLADAITTGDFSLQNAVDVDNVSGMPAYFKTTRALLENIDFTDVDIVTIAFGTNDFTAGLALDNTNDPTDTATFCGALRYSLEKILGAYPHLHVFVCTPTYRFWIDENNDFLYDSDTHEINGKLLTDFVEAVQDISKKYHVKSIDNYYDLGIDKFNRSYWFPANDGTHHNKDGGMLIAQHMANEMF